MSRSVHWVFHTAVCTAAAYGRRLSVHDGFNGATGCRYYAGRASDALGSETGDQRATCAEAQADAALVDAVVEHEAARRTAALRAVVTHTAAYRELRTMLDAAVVHGTFSQSMRGDLASEIDEAWDTLTAALDALETGG